MYVSREVVGQYENKSLKPHRPKKIKRYPIKETSGNENKETSKCPICPTIMEQTLKDRGKTIRLFTRDVFVLVV